ncbi:MAG: chloride channel protein [Thermoplasmatota archaeon]
MSAFRDTLRRFRAKETSFHEGAQFLRRWVLMGILIGFGAGLGTLLLIEAIRIVSQAALGVVVGYSPPAPAGEGGAIGTLQMSRPWALPLVTGLGGLVGGFLVWRFAPSAAGIGTNAAIASFHRGEDIPLKTAALKVGTSAITIGSGMTSGREGPIAQIGAGVGSTVARWLDLSARDRNIALAAGLGAGISAMFKAPLAGAIIGAEIFYTEDFEVEALVPGVIASVVGYALVGYVIGFQPIFTTGQNPTLFTNPLSLALYALLGLVCAIAARLAILALSTSQRAFARVPLYVATAAGGVMTGVIGLLIPSVIGTGYGWAQFAVLQNYALLPPLMLVAAAVAEVLCSSLTLGSGNSGGIFGPSVVTGAFIGAAFGYGANLVVPGIAGPAADFAIVGMMAFFGACAKAPISTIVMVAEMTGGYGLLGPSMVAVVVAFLLAGNDSVFPAQVRTRMDSPVHHDDYAPILLRRRLVRDAMTADPLVLGPNDVVATADRIFLERRIGGIPIVEDGRLVGVLRRREALRTPESLRATTTIGSILKTNPPLAKPDEDLFSILARFTTENTSHFAVVDPAGHLIGIITRTDVGRVARAASSRAGAGAGADSGTMERSSAGL